ncbi:ATP-binding protein [Pseudobutyrivibrio xylanivorans]|uniref:histidine kinase n=1 Tax=Pseudobutyrivibrio xylanivorans TaxID=185007 RepID=A0A5P6VUC3_PSEXY|nr:transporter substrate-binding domain-containing protein [Pseudobutyrivibrio xylanivorans]QFJ55922.1 transporter substrate-binding domain-containing protein [Pseudobutyrivibrio xylanivorans]
MDRNRILFKRFLLVILGFVMIAFQSPVFVSAHNHATKTVRIGYYENEIFQEGASEDSVKSGYAYEYYMKLSEYTGWRYEYVYGTYNDLYQMLVDGDIDMLAGIAFREDREALIGYPEIPMGVEAYVLVKHDFDTEITAEPSTLSGHTIGVLNSNMSATLGNYLKEHAIDATVITYENSAKLLDAFDSDEIDILAAESDGTNIRKHAEVLYAFGTADYYICVNKADTILLDELNEAQSALYTDEPYYLSVLNAKYFGASLSSQTLSNVERNWILAHDKIVIGYLNNYLPYSDTDANGRVTGVVKDIVPKLFDSMNITELDIEYKGFDNYDDMISAVDAEGVDVAFPVAGGLYYSEESGIYQSNSVLSSSTDLIYKNVVIYPDNASFAINNNNRMQYYYVKTNYPNAHMVFYDSIDECLRAVLKGEVDCTTVNGMRANAILKNAEYADLSLRQLSSADARCFGVRIGDEGLLRIINRGIHIMGSDYPENQAYKYVDGLYIEEKTLSLKDFIPWILLVLLLIACVIIVYTMTKLKRCKAAVADLQNVNYIKSNFINDVATNIREPIVEITEEIDSPTAERLLSAVDDIIDLSNFEYGKVTLSEDKIHIPALVRGLESEFQENPSCKNLNLQFNVKEIRNKDVIADKARLVQALTKILNNAVEYSKKGGHIRVEVEEQKCSNPRITNMVFTIKDDGIGMSPEFQKIVFDAYTRENNGMDGKQGVGLGLTISKRIVDLMGGKIEINSTKGYGCEVVVKVPVKICYTR